jgi:hypothetical protein
VTVSVSRPFCRSLIVACSDDVALGDDITIMALGQGEGGRNRLSR